MSDINETWPGEPSDRPARDIARNLMEVVRGESLEAGFSAACDVVYDEWAINFGDELREASEESSRRGPLRKLGEKSEARIAATLHRYDLSSREQYSEVFEALVELRESALGRAGLSFSSTAIVADFMAGLVGPGAGLLDPACGFGSTLLAAARRDSRARIHGIDINAEASNFARRRMQLAGFSPQIDSFDFLEEEPQPLWDRL